MVGKRSDVSRCQNKLRPPRYPALVASATSERTWPPPDSALLGEAPLSNERGVLVCLQRPAGAGTLRAVPPAP